MECCAEEQSERKTIRLSKIRELLISRYLPVRTSLMKVVHRSRLPCLFINYSLIDPIKLVVMSAGNDLFILAVLLT